MEKISKITAGIKITVITQLNEEISIIDQSRFFFNYHIKIVNTNNFTVRLLSRHWEIYDSLHPLRHVDGEGVVGLTPLIQAGEQFSYSSGCDLYSEIGSMSGFYMFERLDSQEKFKVDVPRFDMIFYGKLN
jgi:ApaG protein